MTKYQFKERPGCMTWWLGFIIVTLAISLFRTLIGGPDQLKQMETLVPGVIFPSWMYAYGLSNGLAQLGFAIALYLWKKWGFYGLVTVWVIGIIISIPMINQTQVLMVNLVGPQAASLAKIFVFIPSVMQILITYLVIRPVWDELE
ncbi:MAG: hypothetical protein NTY09_04635 [bacterium]|nr:hypothetical protein [bacterium]